MLPYSTIFYPNLQSPPSAFSFPFPHARASPPSFFLYHPTYLVPPSSVPALRHRFSVINSSSTPSAADRSASPPPTPRTFTTRMAEDLPLTNKHFVFVHGACHGSWCWYKVRTILEKSGHKVTCIDLTGAGINLTDPNTVLTFDQYNQPFYDFLARLPTDEKVVLVGHSLGGGSVTAALCKFTDKISLAVYIAANMNRPGTNPESPRILKDAGKLWEYTYGQGPDQPPTSLIMNKQFVRQYYYGNSPIEDVTLASMLLRPVPCLALRGAYQLPPSPNADTVPRVYLKTGSDDLFHPSTQDSVVSQWPPKLMFVLEESDHAPFFSVPTTLCSYLVEACRSL